MKLNQKIQFPSDLEHVRPLFVRFAAPSAEAVGVSLERASPEELSEITDLSIRLLREEAREAMGLLAHADNLDAAGDVDAAARVRSFVEGIMPVPG